MSAVNRPLHPYVLLSPTEDLRNHNDLAHKYTCYTIAIVVSCIAIAALAIFVTHILTPTYLLLVTILSAAIMPLALPYAQGMRSKSRDYQNLARLDLVAEKELLQLRKTGCNSQILFIRAKHYAWYKEFQRIDTIVQELINKAPKSEEEEVQLSEIKRLKHYIKLETAFRYGLITNPTYLGERRELVVIPVEEIDTLSIQQIAQRFFPEVQAA